LLEPGVPFLKNIQIISHKLITPDAGSVSIKNIVSAMGGVSETFVKSTNVV
jgi:hypothetical protein